MLATIDHEKTKRPLTAATLDRIRATLRAALNAALRQGLIEENPASLVVLPGGAPTAGGGVDRSPCTGCGAARQPGCGGAKSTWTKEPR
ncbi:hypothetical protein [Actinomadura rubrisoli]|uniref:hypothetical protein n=1 Tax=Actinomadura rubrisoli TaxID=2530368 RepID=UPI0014047B38|nr:hypothetical protein [Actinomadura rubrisoli]